MAPQELLAKYRQVLDLTRQMDAMADAGKWEPFIQLEAQRRYVLDLVANERIGQEQELRAIAQNILDLDVKIAEKVQVWMEELKSILSQMATVQRLGQAYTR